MRLKEKDKIRFTFVFFCFLFLAIIFKAVYVQVIIQDKLVAYSDGQLIRKLSIYPRRGNIYDRDGNPLAINIQTYGIFTIPDSSHRNRVSLKKLARIVPSLSYSRIKKKVGQRNRFTWLGRKIRLNEKQVTKIKGLKDIYVAPSPSRFYPNNELLSQTLGFVGVDNTGLSGIEFKFNKDLMGESKVLKYLKDAKGRPIKFETIRNEKQSKDLFLSIELDLQAYVEKKLKEAVLKTNSKKGGIGVMNYETGEILAVANYPSFNPNKLSKKDKGLRRLSFVSDPFEPGSMFKILTVASAFENKIADTDTNYYCEKGRLKIENHVISEARNSSKFEWLSVKEIIEKSSNIGITKMAFELSFPQLKKTLLKFKVGQKTDIEIPGESRGIFTSQDNVSPLSLSNISFGQGVATTGIQILAAFAAIANEGLYVRPTIFKDGNKDRTGERILGKKISQELVDLLINAVSKGTGRRAQIRHFDIAGKTSTAQKLSDKGKYEDYVSSFIGFPVGSKKKFVILVYLDRPKQGQYYGGVVAAPIFRQIAHYMLYENRESEDLLVNGKLPLVDSYFRRGIKRKSIDIKELEEGKIPNFVGLDKISSNRLAQKVGINIQSKGFGLVYEQRPPPGDIINHNKSIELRYAPPQFD